MPRRPPPTRASLLSAGAAAAVLFVAPISGCVGAAGGPSGPVVSPTGVTYDPGISPSQSRFSQTASLYLRSDQPEPALEQLRQGIEAEPENPIHHFLAGVAYARLGEYAEADASFEEAERLYPAYELDVEPERAAAWAEAYNRGAEAYAEGDVEEAIEAWSGAILMYDLRPEAHRNLAMVFVAEGRYRDAADTYRKAIGGLEGEPATRILAEDEVLQREREREELEEGLAELLLIVEDFAAAEPFLRNQLGREPENVALRQNLATALEGQGRLDEAREIYDVLLEETGLAETELFNLGVALFRSGDPARAAEAFQRLIELRPHSRDVWFNYANALFAAGDWETLISIEGDLSDVDPLNENATLIVARAHLERDDEAAALERLRRLDATPAFLEGLVLRSVGSGSQIEGRIIGNERDHDQPLQLRFTFYGAEGALGSESITLMPPPPGESQGFEVSFGAQATSYRYVVDGP